MATPDSTDREDTTRLLALASQGDQGAWWALLARDRGRLRRMVALRLDRRLQGRVVYHQGGRLWSGGRSDDTNAFSH